MEYYKGTIPIIDADGSATDLSHPKDAKFGLVPRDYGKHPEKMFAPPSQMQLIPESEWDARYDEQEATKSSLEHLYLGEDMKSPRFQFLDQNGFPDCWCHSTCHGAMFARLVAGLSVLRFNAVAVATMIGELNGGWCGMSAKFAKEHGLPVVGDGPGEWPYQTRSNHDTPELRASMALHKVTEDWYDLTRQVWDQKQTTQQIATCSFNNIATPEDYNWWGHSVCGIRHVRIEKGSWGRLILNSWPNWGRFGLAVLRGSQAVANGSVALIATSPSTK